MISQILPHTGWKRWGSSKGGYLEDSHLLGAPLPHDLRSKYKVTVCQAWMTYSSHQQQTRKLLTQEIEIHLRHCKLLHNFINLAFDFNHHHNASKHLHRRQAPIPRLGYKDWQGKHILFLSKHDMTDFPQLGAVDWSVVGEANGLSKGAAYMRFNRIVSALGDDKSPSTSPTSSPKRKKPVKSEDDDEPDVMASPTKKKRGGGRKKKNDLLEHAEANNNVLPAQYDGPMNLKMEDEFPDLASLY